MAGGKATRMGGEEKAMLELAGKPMISYVLDTLIQSASIGRIFVAVSPNVQRTAEYVKCHGEKKVSIIMTPGSGYIDDTAYAARALNLGEPFLVISADLPLVTPEVIDAVVSAYSDCGKEALSVRIDARHAEGAQDLILTDTGSPTIPAGINVIHGAHLDRAQDEHILILNDPALAVNVNYRKDLTSCAHLMAGMRRRTHH